MKNSKNSSLREMIRGRVKSLVKNTLNKEASKDSILAFGRHYLPHYFSDKEGVPVASPAFHSEICSVLQDESPGKRAVWEAPRGHAKSTLISLCYPLWCLCEKKKKYIVLISDTAGQAETFLGFITREIEENEKLKVAYGDDLLPKRDNQNAVVKWTDKEIITKSNIKVSARGTGTSVRGLRHEEHRPDLIIIDDPENDEAVLTPDRRRKGRAWFRDSLLNMLDRDGDVVALGTRIHFDCLITRILTNNLEEGEGKDEKHLWRGKSYKAISTDDQGREVAIWQDYWSLDRLKAKKEEIGSVSFEKEFQNNPLNPEDQLFKEEWFKYYSLRDIEGLNLKHYAYFDPALGKDTGDYSAIIVIGKADNGNLYVLHAWIQRVSVVGAIETIFETDSRFDLEKFGIETNQFQMLIKEEIDKISKQRGRYIRTVGVCQKVNKLLRIERLSPPMEQGLLFFCTETAAGNQRLLIEQLQQFPKGAHDDGADALEGAVNLAKNTSRPRFRQL